MHIEGYYMNTHGHDLTPFDSLFSGKHTISNTTTKAEMSSSEMMLGEIMVVIEKVGKNQLSIGQGWRAVKRIMQTISEDKAVQEPF